MNDNQIFEPNPFAIGNRILLPKNTTAIPYTKNGKETNRYEYDLTKRTWVTLVDCGPAKTFKPKTLIGVGNISADTYNYLIDAIPGCENDLKKFIALNKTIRRLKFITAPVVKQLLKLFAPSWSNKQYQKFLDLLEEESDFTIHIHNPTVSWYGKSGLVYAHITHKIMQLNEQTIFMNKLTL